MSDERTTQHGFAAAPLLGACVTRPVHLDDGTWQQRGDECLPGPLRRGTVIEDAGRTVVVRWDDEWVARGMKQVQTLLRHGVDIAPNDPSSATAADSDAGLQKERRKNQ